MQQALYAVYAIWLLLEASLLAKRSRQPLVRSPDRGSLLFIGIAIVGGVGAGALIAVWGPTAIVGAKEWLHWIGCVLMVGGLALRWASIFVLWRYFTIDVAIPADGRFVQTGMYRHVRHPSYAGEFLAFLGLGLSLANVLSMLAIWLPVGAAFTYRIVVEERALSAALGPDYEAYCRRTKRLIPRLF